MRWVICLAFLLVLVAAGCDASTMTLTSEVTRTVTLPPVTETVTSTPPAATVTETRTVTRTVTPVLTPVPTYTYRVVRRYPHDPQAFTQGLVFCGGFLYEGTGLNSGSSLRKVVLESREVLKIRTLPEQYFGEGITIFGERIVQLTWLSNTGFIYDLESFELVGEFHYATQGWGLTHDGERLIMSDGTSTLHFLNPETFEEVGKVEVHDWQRGPVMYLNELEYIEGEVWANVWQTDMIARIDPGTGQVTGWIDLAGLLSSEERAGHVDVLNGIAWDAEGERLFVTGKLWPRLFEIEVVPGPG